LYFSRGGLWAQKGRHGRAIADYDEAIRLDPKSAIAYYARGFSRKASGDWEGAKADFAEAARLDPKFEEP
jgi:tetratricopeptide (TPR) repeat protein